MIDIKLQDGIKSIPNCWEDIKLGQYLKIAKLDINDEEEFKSLLIIEAYTGIPLLTLKRMPLKELQAISQALAFTTTELPEVPIESFTIGNDTYHVMQSFLLEEAQDYFAVEAIMTEFENNSIKALPKLLAVLCKKSGENLDTIPMAEREQLFLDNLNVCDANSLRVFFYNCASLFQINSLLYLNREQIIQQKVDECKNTLKQLDGTGLYGRWLKKTLQRFLRYYEQSWKTYSSGTQSNFKEYNSKKTLKRLLRRKTVRK